MFSSRDIHKALATARTALDAGNLATFKRAARYAERRLGMRGCVDQNAPELAWSALHSATLWIDDDKAEERRLLWGAA